MTELEGHKAAAEHILHIDDTTPPEQRVRAYNRTLEAMGQEPHRQAKIKLYRAIALWYEVGAHRG